MDETKHFISLKTPDMIFGEKILKSFFMDNYKSEIYNWSRFQDLFEKVIYIKLSSRASS